MKSIFQNDKAFAPMYDETVRVDGSRPGGKTVCQSLAVCVLSDADGDPIGDGVAMDTDREDVVVCCRADDWRFVQSLVRGDTVTRFGSGGRKYAVQSVRHDFALGVIIKARSI